MTAPTGPGAPGTPASDPANASVGQLFGEVTKDFSTLIRQEIALAKAEGTASAKQAGKGAGMFGGAAVAGHFVLLFLSLSLWWGLARLIGDGGEDPALGWSGLIVAIVWGVIAAVLASKGKQEMARTKGLPQTAATVKQIPDALKGQETP